MKSLACGCRKKLSKEDAEVAAAILCSNWEADIRYLECHPFMVIVDSWLIEKRWQRTSLFLLLISLFLIAYNLVTVDSSFANISIARFLIKLHRVTADFRNHLLPLALNTCYGFR
jgi:uncharacterized membrane protein YjdF